MNETVFILTATFSCNISVSTEEITIKQPSNDQRQIEKIIIQSELKAYQETLAAYKNISPYSKYISDIPGFEDTFQQKRDYYIEQYGIIRISNESISSMSLVNPFTFGLNIDSPIVYVTPHDTIINARGLAMAANASNHPDSLDELCNTSISGLSINENTISFNMDSTFSKWRKPSIKH
ncbi:hypothetical protein [Lysinibacillus boronitolerans]|uniref:hypothetical protein n=1 Tax=Lysinibacillus boronitolerans TaxID=309788 RepID=UPI002897C8CB|nr:hypothetical protein [Lysinibacillus boronitolerans]